MKIFIDMGHSGPVEPGAVNHELGLTEADIVVNIGLFLWRILAEEGHEVLLSRAGPIDDSDSDQLTWRTDKANQWGADLYICLHCNSFGGPGPNGAEVLYAPGASDSSKRLAASIQAELVGLGLTDRGSKEQGLFIRWADMPAVLIEHAFLSNMIPPEGRIESDAVMLRDRPLDFAAADARGILKYIQEGNHA
ncbi:MAG: N-acetylmuramoyl-L-alanine amidase [Negativicutes bacterium]